MALEAGFKSVHALLNHALNSRVTIEQAKGMLAERAAPPRPANRP